MTHKEKMDYLKENDPITYYEMGGQDTAPNTADFIIVVLWALGIFGLVKLIF